MSRRQFKIYMFFFTLLSGVFLYFIYIHTSEVPFFDFLGGPVGNDYNPIEILWWLILFTPVWAACGGLIDLEMNLAQLLLYRIENVRTWWLNLLLKVLVINLWYFILSILILSLQNPSIFNMQFLKIILLIIVHSLSMTVTMIWVYIITKHIDLSFVVLIVTEATAKLLILLGIDPVWLPLSWGMAGYCKLFFNNGGFSYHWVIIIQIIYCLLLYALPLRFKSIIFRGAKL